MSDLRLCFFNKEILLEETSFKGFPVVDNITSMQLFGYVRRKDINVALGKFWNILLHYMHSYDVYLYSIVKTYLEVNIRRRKKQNLEVLERAVTD